MTLLGKERGHEVGTGGEVETDLEGARSGGGEYDQHCMKFSKN